MEKKELSKMRVRLKSIGRLMLGGFAAAIVVGVVAAPAASALGTYRYWYSQSAPLVAYDDGAAQGAGYGQWRVDNISTGTKSIAFAYVKDYFPTGNYIYLEHQVQSNAGYCASPEYLSCNQQYYNGQMDKSSGTNASAWTKQSVIVTPDLNANYARGKVRICEEQSFSPNPCSGWATTQGDWF